MLENTNLRVYRRAAFLIFSALALLISAFIVGGIATSEKYWFLSPALVLGLFGAFIILKRPLLGFALIFFLTPLGPVTRLIGGGRTISFALAALLIGVYVAKLLVFREKIKLDRTSLLACAFLVWAVITSLWAYDSNLSLNYSLRLGQMIAIYILALNYCRSQKDLDVLTLSFAAGAAVAATVTIFKGSAFQNSHTVTAGGRLSLSEQFNPNLYSAMLGMGLIFVFYHLYRTGNKLLKVLFLLSILIIGYSIIKAQSRAVWIAIPVSLSVSIILVTRNLKLIRNTIIAVTILAGLVASAYYAGIINKAIINRYETLFSGERGATAGRSEIWKVGLVILKDNFPLGVGFKNFNIAYFRYVHSVNVTFIHPSGDPHNTFLGVLAETGLVGFVIFMSIFAYLFKEIWYIKDPTIRLIQMWLLSSLILISLSGTWHDTPWFWFVLLTVALETLLMKGMDKKVLLR